MDIQSQPEAILEDRQDAIESNTQKIFLVCLAGYCVPGLGHALLGKWDRAITFFCSITFMFVIGLHLQGELFSPAFDSIFSILKFIADAGTGLFFWISLLSGLGGGDSTAYTYDYANKFLYVAGLLNMLVVVDVFDITMGRKR